MKSKIVLASVALLSVSCLKRGYNSDTASNETPTSEDMVTIYATSPNVVQPMIFASVDDKGECRGGKPRYRVDIAPGGPIPDLKVSVTTKRICIAGQATPTGQDIKYWDMPADLKKGQTWVIKGDKIVPWTQDGTGSNNPVEKSFSLRSKQGLAINVKAKVEFSKIGESSGTRNITSFQVGTDRFEGFRAVVSLKCQAHRGSAGSRSYESTFTIDGLQASGGAPFVAYDFGKHQIEYIGVGGDNDKCRVELSLVMRDVWQTDPVNGTNNFVLDL